jgi:hypothetical protein
MTRTMGYSIFLKAKKKKFSTLLDCEKKKVLENTCVQEERFGLKMHAKNLNMN